MLSNILQPPGYSEIMSTAEIFISTNGKVIFSLNLFLGWKGSLETINTVSGCPLFSFSDLESNKRLGFVCLGIYEV